jgi:GxxExxY protein
LLEIKKLMTENEISKHIISAAIKIHRELGPGLLESVYEAILAHELRQSGLDVLQQVAVPLVYKDIEMNIGYRIDMLIESKVLVELKSVENLAPVHFAQTLTYLRLSGLKLGILINFNVALLKEGFHRVVNGL